MPSAHFDLASPALQPFPPQAPVRRTSRWLPRFGACLGLVGLATGAAGCSRPGASSEAAKPAYSDQQVADAKKAVCEAYAKGIRSIRIVASKRAENPADTLPIAVNSRVAEVAVSTYFRDTLNTNPATPPDLQGLISTLAQNYQELVLIQLADGTPVDWKATKDSIEETASKLDELCR